MKTATEKLIIKGIKAKRLPKPNVSNIEQNTSAKITSNSENFDPIPNGSGKLCAFSAKCMSLGKPWVSNKLKAKPTLSINNPRSRAIGFEENNSFFM